MLCPHSLFLTCWVETYRRYLILQSTGDLSSLRNDEEMLQMKKQITSSNVEQKVTKGLSGGANVFQ